jgi:UDP-N-acetylmuramoylalanine--D-glutamate ligase
MKNWSGKSILIIGAARQGLAAARYLAHKGARVTINDKKEAVQLQAAIDAMASLPIRWELGAHNLNILDGIDLVCISGGVPLELPLIRSALQLGIPLSNDSQLFMEVAPCKVMGITGSAGKTTTTTLVGRMAQAGYEGPGSVWVGGNIGKPLIDLVDEMRPQDLVIMEFSSFQLELMTISPHISAILNITPNHLDRHGTMEAYAAAKAHIIAYQSREDITVLGRDNPGAWALSGDVKGKLVSFGHSALPKGQTGTFIAGQRLVWQDEDQQIEIMPIDRIHLPGRHNQLNVLAACALSFAADLPVEAMGKGVDDFYGVPHRLELVRSWNGSAWYNDSKATTPDGVIASVQSFTEPLILMVGGRDKHLPWEQLASLIRQRVDHLIVFGEAAPLIMEALTHIPTTERPFSVTQCQGVFQAVQSASKLAKAGDVVLLSPGGTSFDEFNNYEERGERFKEWVAQLS